MKKLWGESLPEKVDFVSMYSTKNPITLTIMVLEYITLSTLTFQTFILSNKFVLDKKCFLPLTVSKCLISATLK